MIYDHHDVKDKMLIGIKGMRWLTYVRPVKADNDAIFSINDACDVTASHCQPNPINQETLT